MKHSADATHKIERPNLLSSSDRNTAPAIDILSSLENRQKLGKGNKLDRKKMWTVAFFILSVIGIAAFLQFENLQNLSVKIGSALTPTNTRDQSVKPLLNANRQSALKEPKEAAAPSIVEDVKTTLEPSAILVDIPIDNEKTAVSNETLTSQKLPIAIASDAKETQSKNVTPVAATNPQTSIKTKAAPQNMATKKLSIAQEKDIERKNIDPLKAITSTEKNHPKTYDNDIALLSALVANTSKSREDVFNKLSNNASAKKTIAPAINLDVVERNQGDNTKNLLARCEKLGGMEAKLCHDRICAGSWQSESACSPSKG